MIPTQIEDETGEIQATFFDNLAEELIVTVLPVFLYVPK